jgi:hypothetical protein
MKHGQNIRRLKPIHCNTVYLHAVKIATVQIVTMIATSIIRNANPVANICEAKDCGVDKIIKLPPVNPKATNITTIVA